MNIILRCEITSLKEAESCLGDIQAVVTQFCNEAEAVSGCITRYRLYNREGGSIYNAKEPHNINAHTVCTIELSDDDEVFSLMQHLKDEFKYHKLFNIIACLDGDVEDTLENVI